MSTIFKTLAAATIAVMVMVAGGVAQTWDCGATPRTVTATLSDGTLTISGTGDMENYLQTSSGYITNRPWYSSISSITSIVIGDGVTTIGSGAFYGYSDLTSVTIPNSVTTIGDGAFSGCTGLTSLTIGDGVTTIGSSAFYGCSGLTSLTIGDGVTTIEHSAFYGCSGLTSVTIPNSVTSVEGVGIVGGSHSGAFSYCTGLTSLTIPDGVTSIGDAAFGGCTGLTSVTIPISLTSVGENVFYGCSGLTSVTIVGKGKMIDYRSDFYPYYRVPWYNVRSSVNSVVIEEGVTSIGQLAFSGCTGLTSVTIPNSVTSIGNTAFSGCTGLTSVTIPNSVTYLSGFDGCTGLTSVTIPNSVTNIGSRAFSSCTGLTSIVVSENNAYYSSVDGILFNKDKTVLLQYPAGKQGAYSIPSSVTSIGQSAFSGCTGLTSVTIPNSVTSIEYAAFSGCTGLTSVTIPNSVTEIGSRAFKDCRGLTSVTIPNSVKYLSGFDGCTGLTSVTIPNSVTYLSGFDGCTGLTSVTIPNSVTYLSGFDGCTGLTSVTIPNSVTSIGGNAFYGCSGLTSVTIPNSVTTIGQYAFYGCTGLTSVTIPNNVTSIEDFAFTNCSGMTTVTIPNSVTTIGQYAFYGCTGLTSVTIPNSVTSIGEYAFHGCTGLTSINSLRVVPPTVGSNAFSNLQSYGVIMSSACLYVPQTVISAYSSADVWKDFSCIEAINGALNITFNSQGGSAVSSQYELSGGNVTKPTDPIRTDYIFDGWYKEAECTTLWNFDTGTVTSDITLYAKWIPVTYAITYNLNGGSLSSTNPASYNIETPAFTLNTPTKTGYTFVGWTGANGTTPQTSVSIPLGSTGTRTYTANWTPVTYAISYDLNGGIVSSANPASYNIETAAFTLNNPTKTGYTFAGWTGTDVTIPTTTVSVPLGSTNDRTYTANWTINSYTITFNSQNGSAVPSQTIPYGGKVTEPADPTRASNNFDGWFQEPACVNAWDFGVDVVGAADLTLYAKWTKLEIHVVTFNSQGGSAVGSEHVEHGSKASTPAAPTSAGYTFGGWYAEPNCVNAWDFGAHVITSAVTLFAKWTPVTYAIIYDLNGGTVSSANPVNYTIQTPAFTLNNPTKIGYTFAGWTGTNGTIPTTTVSIPLGSINDRTYTANWTINTYAVTFNSQNGSAVSSQTIPYGGKVTEPADPTRADYYFYGWFKEAACTNEWDFGVDVVGAAAVTLYAKWSAIPDHPVHFESQGGSAVSSEYVQEGKRATTPAAPTRAGYTFGGWYKEAGCINAWDFTATAITSSVTLYAKWKPIAVTNITGVPDSVEVAKTYTLAGTVVPDNAANKTITWTVANAGITGAGIYGNILLTSATGSAIIKATIKDGTDTGTDYEQYFVITVAEPAVSVLTPARVIPQTKPTDEATVISPVSQLTGEFTAGPNPVAKQSGSVNFYRQGKRVANCELRIYDATGNIVNKVKINDKAIGTQARRQVGTWDLRDTKGRLVSEGTYLVKGVVKTLDGKSEKVSVIVGVR